MIAVVLPTAGLVREYADFDQLFSFYEDGLRGLIRDMVLLSDLHAPTEQTSAAEYVRELASDGLVEKVLREYSDSPDARFLFHTSSRTREIEVEIAVEMIYQSVMEMMNALLMRAVYEVCKQKWSWLGNDLIAHLTVLEDLPSE